MNTNDRREDEPRPKSPDRVIDLGKRKAGRAMFVVALVAVGMVMVTVGGIAGYMLGGRSTAPAESSDQKPTVWYCSMHPQIQQPKPGKCSICFMDLIILEDSGHGSILKMSKAAMALADIQTVPVRRQLAAKPVRMVGKVDYDETALADITARVSGRLDRLFVDYTGVPVRPNDHLVSIYSPELIVAQRELLQTWDAHNRATRPETRQLLATTLAATEEKLRLLGLLEEQIEEIKRLKTPSDHLTIYSPAGGIVVRKHAMEGQYVQTGTKIYTIADLTRVWVLLDAYESDVPWLHAGQEVEFSTESYPGESFTGRVTFIDPVLDEKTRTVAVRLNVSNPSLRLKPGMFVRAVVQSRLGAGGRVMDRSLAGKWVSPMHPEVIKDGPGQCDVCGMDLVPAETLGLVSDREQAELPLVIPVSAPLITGKRAVVYVRLPDEEEPTFEGREVVLGHRAGEHYLVEQGLEEGELVVTSGNFKIDADLQLKARPSMMGMTASSTLTIPDRFRRRLDAVYSPYLKLQTALADDRLDDARTAWIVMREAIDTVPRETVDPNVEQAWRSVREQLEGHLAFDSRGADIETLRARFEWVAVTMLDLANRFGHATGEPLFEAFCPMAFDNRGAPWLQLGDTVDNPYFGHRMKRCGTIRREFASSGDMDVSVESGTGVFAPHPNPLPRGERGPSQLLPRGERGPSQLLPRGERGPSQLLPGGERGLEIKEDRP